MACTLNRVASFLVVVMTSIPAFSAQSQPFSIDEPFNHPDLALDLDGDGVPDRAVALPSIDGVSPPRFQIVSGSSGAVLLDCTGVDHEHLRRWVLETTDYNGDGLNDIELYTDFVDNKGALRRRSHVYSRDNGSLLYRSSRLTATWHWWAADYDGNNIVEQDDFDAFNLDWLAAIAGEDPPERLDINRDGVVDQRDIDFITDQVAHPPSIGQINRRRPPAPPPPPPPPPEQAGDGGAGGVGEGDSGEIGNDQMGSSGGIGSSDGNSPDCPRVELPPPGFFCLSGERPCDTLTLTATGNGPFSWSATNADILGSPTDRAVTLSICTPGEVIIHLEGPPGVCQHPQVIRFIAYLVDLDAFQNENVNLDDLSYERDAMENISGDSAHPGAVVRCSTFDADGDLIPEFADGMNLQPLLTTDDHGLPPLHPIRISVLPHVPPTALVKISYPAADPMDVTLGETGWDPGQGMIRLWRNQSQRNPRSIREGGDYIPPGIYELSELPPPEDFAPWDSMIWVEAVRPSLGVGDVVLSISVDPDGPTDHGQHTLPFLCPDQIRLTCVEMRIHQLDPLTNEWLDTNGFVGSSFAPQEELQLLGADWTLGPWCEYVVEAVDPRVLDGRDITIEGQDLPLYSNGGVSCTMPFFCAKIDDSVTWLPWPERTVDLQRSYAVVKYNPEYSCGAGPKLNQPAPGQAELAPILVEVVDQMESEGWSSSNLSDAGAFGDEVHARVSARLQSNTRWLTDVWVDRNTRKILSIGGRPAGSLTDTAQIDLVYLDKDYHPVVNEIRDNTKIELFDIKASAKVAMDGPQITKLKPFAREGRVHLCTSPKIWRPQEGWVINRRWLTKKTLFRIVGTASAVAVVFSIYEQIEALDRIDDAIQRIAATPQHDRKVVLIQDAATMVVEYLRPQFEMSNYAIAGLYPTLVAAFSAQE